MHFFEGKSDPDEPYLLLDFGGNHVACCFQQLLFVLPPYKCKNQYL